VSKTRNHLEAVKRHSNSRNPACVITIACQPAIHHTSPNVQPPSSQMSARMTLPRKCIQPLRGDPSLLSPTCSHRKAKCNLGMKRSLSTEEKEKGGQIASLNIEPSVVTSQYQIGPQSEPRNFRLQQQSSALRCYQGTLAYPQPQPDALTASL